MMSRNVLLLTSLDHVAFNENRNAVFIWSVEMFFIFCRTNTCHIYATPYEANILCDCIININTLSQADIFAFVSTTCVYVGVGFNCMDVFKVWSISVVVCTWLNDVLFSSTRIGDSLDNSEQ